MSDFSESRKSPCCGAEAWDQECDECGTDGEDEKGDTCQECDGDGHITGWCECSVCGDIFEEGEL